MGLYDVCQILENTIQRAYSHVSEAFPLCSHIANCYPEFSMIYFASVNKAVKLGWLFIQFDSVP